MNPKQPFYVDVGTSVVAIRCASNHDVIARYDHVLRPHTLKLAKDICDRMNKEVEICKPRRNCDRFETAEEAWDAYDEWVESYRAKGEIPPFNEFGWLFAPATETEGGAK